MCVLPAMPAMISFTFKARVAIMLPAGIAPDLPLASTIEFDLGYDNNGLPAGFYADVSPEIAVYLVNRQIAFPV